MPPGHPLAHQPSGPSWPRPSGMMAPPEAETSRSLICPSCQHENREGRRFCGDCVTLRALFLIRCVNARSEWHLCSLSLKKLVTFDRKRFGFDSGDYIERYLSKNGRSPELKKFLGQVKAVELPEVELLLDPYVLGVWLGDGTASDGVITMTPEDAVTVRKEFALRGFATTDRATDMVFGVSGLKVLLRDYLGVLNNKHIPPEYLMGSIEQRWDLVRGLMDTDGNIAKSGQCVFAQKDVDIVDSFRRILWSLGIRNSMCSYTAKIGSREFLHASRVEGFTQRVNRAHRADHGQRPRLSDTKAHAGDDSVGS